MEQYQYFISVRMEQDKDLNLKRTLSSVFEVKPNEVERIKLAENMKDNKIFETSAKEAVKATGVSHIGAILNSLNQSARANNETVHKFTMQGPISSVSQVDIKKVVSDNPGVIGKHLKNMIEGARLQLVREWFEMIIGLSMKDGAVGKEYKQWLINSKIIL